MKSTPAKSFLLSAAVTGMLSVAAPAMANAQTTNTNSTIAGNTPHVVLASSDKHSCKGQNSCKGKGGCESGDNGCKGKNSCKGKGGCNTSGSKFTLGTKAV